VRGTPWCETNTLWNLNKKIWGAWHIYTHCLKKWGEASPVSCSNYFAFLSGGCIGVARGTKGAMAPQIFGKYSDFVLWEAFFQIKCYSPKIKHFAPPNFWAGYTTGRMAHCYSAIVVWKNVLHHQWRAEVWWCPGRLFDLCPPLKSSIEQWSMVVIVTEYMLFVTSQCDVCKPTFWLNLWRNMHIVLHAVTHSSYSLYNVSLWWT